MVIKALKKSHAESYLERTKASGLITHKNESAFLAVAEMMNHPLTIQQKREQVRRGDPHGVRCRNPPKIWLPNEK